jgi:hypothetical protein
MPVRRYRSVEDIGTRWYSPGTPDLFQAIRRLWLLGDRTLQPRFPQGVFRHRSIEEMNAMQEKWALANFESYMKRRSAEKADLEAQD